MTTEGHLPRFKEFDLKFVANKKRLIFDEAESSLKQPLSAFLCLPKELIRSILLFCSILSKSTLARSCKKIYFLIDLNFEQQMYQATLKAKQDYKFSVDLEKWYKSSLKMRACAFDDIKYLDACFGPDPIFKYSPNPFAKEVKRPDLLLNFKFLFEANAVALFEYFVHAYENLEKDSDAPWKYINNENFQSFLWISVSSLAHQLVVNSVPVQIVKGSIVDKIMQFASKYSHILLRIILSPQALSQFKFPPLSLCSAAQLLSDLLQHKKSYPFNLTDSYPDPRLFVVAYTAGIDKLRLQRGCS
jgi:hypothetical protein